MTRIWADPSLIINEKNLIQTEQCLITLIFFVDKINYTKPRPRLSLNKVEGVFYDKHV